MLRLNLKQRLMLLVGLLFFTTLVGGIIMIWYTYDTARMTQEILSNPINLSKIIHRLQYNLLMQKGIVTYFSRDKDPEHLAELQEQRLEFLKGMSVLKEALDPKFSREIADISLKYSAYVSAIDRVVAYYLEEKEQLAKGLHEQLRKEYMNIVKDFDGLWAELIGEIEALSHKNLKRAMVLRVIAFGAIVLVLISGFVLNFLLLKKMINPLQEIHEKFFHTDGSKVTLKDISQLKSKVDELLSDMDYTQEELQRSRETLLQAEKMALVGRLAAGTAHSIRNPLTSVKMRLYSLSRNLELTPQQREDFEVISQEIRHIDNILQNFLEFSKPPKLKPKPMSPSDVVDHLLDLMHHRLLSHSVSAKVIREGKLPLVMLDQELLKEAMANIVINACEAMESGGELTITEEVKNLSDLGRCVAISISDTGPGMPEEIRSKAFQPFFTTKDQGTGLGLSIANRIIHEHGGKIELLSREGEGSTFTIYLPTIS